MKMKLILLAAAAAVLAAPGPALASDYPNKPVRVIVPFPAGGAADNFARIVAENLQNELKQPFVVENVPGGASMTGIDQVVKSAKDGYTIGSASTGGLAVNQTLFAGKIPYDVAKDIQPLALMTITPNMLVVNPKRIAARNLPELIDYLKANPGKVTFGSAGIGTTQHLAGELLQQMTGTTMVHIPYKGTTAMLPDLIGGQIDLAFENVAAVLPHVKSGAVHPIASAEPKRPESLPDLPTVAETVPGFAATAWHGYFATAGIPDDVRSKLATSIRDFMAKPETVERFKKLGAIPVTDSTPESFAAFIAADAKRWKEVVEKGNIKPQ